MTATTVRTPPVRSAEVRGRAFGVTLLAFFGLAWIGWGTGGHLSTAAEVPVMMVAAAVAVVLAWSAWRLAVRVPVDKPAGGGRDVTGRTYGLVVAVEWVGLFLIAGVLGATGHGVVIPAVVCAGVGLHFVPLARLFRLPAYHGTAVLLCVVAVATFVLAPVTSTAALWTLLPGIGAMSVLYGTCVVLLRQIRAWMAR